MSSPALLPMNANRQSECRASPEVDRTTAPGMPQSLTNSPGALVRRQCLSQHGLCATEWFVSTMGNDAWSGRISGAESAANRWAVLHPPTCSIGISKGIRRSNDLNSRRNIFPARRPRLRRKRFRHAGGPGGLAGLRYRATIALWRFVRFRLEALEIGYLRRTSRSWALGKSTVTQLLCDGIRQTLARYPNSWRRRTLQWVRLTSDGTRVPESDTGRRIKRQLRVKLQLEKLENPGRGSGSYLPADELLK